MMYRVPQEHMLRCAFPRGRVLKQVEDDLSILTQLIVKFTPNESKEFDRLIDEEYGKMRSVSLKSIKNFRTEMTRLFGLINVSENGMVTPSKRTELLVETQNFPLFFKTFCHKFQFPNGINKPQETIKFLEAGVHFKPAKFLLEFFDLGVARFGAAFCVDGTEISNLVFNDSRVTTGRRTAAEVLELLIALRNQRDRFETGSKMVQHGREFLGYMFLAGLLIQDESGKFHLNETARTAIDFIKSDAEFFQIPEDFTTDLTVRKQTLRDWWLWFGDVSETEKNKFAPGRVTSEEEIPELTEVGIEVTPEMERAAAPTRADMKEIGDKGELVVLKYERERVFQIRPDKVALVQKVSNDTSLGYDIQSLELEDVTKKKYIEVKTTERTFPPSKDVLTYFRMSSNEWDTAKSFKECYYIYRVFLIRGEASIFVIKDPVKKYEDGHILLEALQYRVIVKEAAGSYAK